MGLKFAGWVWGLQSLCKNYRYEMSQRASEMDRFFGMTWETERDLIELAQNRVQWQTTVITIMNLHIL
jgi:hypothetical protein